MPGTALLWGAASPDEITGVQLPVRGLYQALGGLGSQSPWNENAEFHPFNPIGNDN